MDISDGVHLSVVAHTLLEDVDKADFDVVAGIGPYADALSHAVAILADKNWTTPREGRKERGTLSFLEGYRPQAGDRILFLYDDSIGVTDQTVIERLQETGATIVAIRSVETPDRG